MKRPFYGTVSYDVRTEAKPHGFATRERRVQANQVSLRTMRQHQHDIRFYTTKSLGPARQIGASLHPRCQPRRKATHFLSALFPALGSRGDSPLCFLSGTASWSDVCECAAYESVF